MSASATVFVNRDRTDAYRRLSAAVRSEAGCKGKRYPIALEDGFAAPEVRGESFYWTWTPNPKGTRVRRSVGSCPYRTYYHGSSLRVVVGRGWLTENGMDEFFLAPAGVA